MNNTADVVYKVATHRLVRQTDLVFNSKVTVDNEHIVVKVGNLSGRNNESIGDLHKHGFELFAKIAVISNQTRIG